MDCDFSGEISLGSSIQMTVGTALIGMDGLRLDAAETECRELIRIFNRNCPDRYGGIATRYRTCRTSSAGPVGTALIGMEGLRLVAGGVGVGVGVVGGSRVRAEEGWVLSWGSGWSES